MGISGKCLELPLPKNTGETISQKVLKTAFAKFLLTIFIYTSCSTFKRSTDGSMHCIDSVRKIGGISKNVVYRVSSVIFK